MFRNAGLRTWTQKASWTNWLHPTGSLLFWMMCSLFAVPFDRQNQSHSSSYNTRYYGVISLAAARLSSKDAAQTKRKRLHLVTDWRDALDLSDRWRTRTVTSATSEASHTSERWRWCMSIITEVCGSTTSPCKNTLKGLFPGNSVSFLHRTLVYIEKKHACNHHVCHRGLKS